LIPEPYSSMVYVAVYTGLRVSELIGLRWGDIHEHSITIDERYCRGDWGEPKSDASNTTIPVNQKVIERIHRLRTLTADVKAADEAIEIGGETTYQIHVVNQGSKAASNVQIVADFPAELKATVEVRAGRATRRYRAVKSNGPDDPYPRSRGAVSRCETTISWCVISSRQPVSLESPG